MNYILIILFIVVVIAGYFIYAYYSSPKTGEIFVKRGPFDLKGGIQPIKLSELGATPNAFLTSGSAAFQCFVYLDSNVRTGNASDCGTDPAQPSCSTGLYQECDCGTDLSCLSCVHPGYKNLVNIYDTFKLEVITAPDASRQQSVSAQIVVKTSPTQTTYAIETFALPPLPEQKWTMITVSKEGRQIFVYYNSTLVLSKKALHTFSVMPPASQIPVYAGDATLSGNIAMVRFLPSHQGLTDVATTYQSMTDTRGNLNSLQAVPNSSSYTIQDTSVPAIISNMCLDGSCLKGATSVQIVPKIPSIYNPLETAYA
jgi:hypothetical protein